MYLNHLRQKTSQWDGVAPSHCPDCQAPLVARRGDKVRHHWAHAPGARIQAGCAHAESEWHLDWKAAMERAGMEIEHAIKINDKQYRLDAYKADGNRAIELVHSLRTDDYLDKNRDLLAHGYDPIWMFDGAPLASARVKPTRQGDGLVGLLKPSAWDLAQHLIHEHVVIYCHHKGHVWKHWRKNIWYPAPTSSGMIYAYNRAARSADL